MSKLVKIDSSDVFVGKKFRCSMDCCSSKVLSVFRDSKNEEFVAYETTSHQVEMASMVDFVDIHRSIPKHTLNAGDVFTLSGVDGTDTSGLTFLYVDDDTVVQFGSNDSFSPDVSFEDLDCYLRRLTGSASNYNRIVKLFNIQNYGIIAS